MCFQQHKNRIFHEKNRKFFVNYLLNNLVRLERRVILKLSNVTYKNHVQRVCLFGFNTQSTSRTLGLSAAVFYIFLFQYIERRLINMKTLQNECLLVITKNLSHPSIGPNICKLQRSLKTILLEKILWHESLNDPKSWSSVVRTEYFENLRKLVLPQNKALTDKFMSTVSVSGCKLDSIYLVVPLIPHDERLAPLSGKGVSALFANQNELEYLNLVWCINFKADVLTRIRSDFLRTVEIVGDAVCRCFEYNNVLRDKVHLYQRDLW